MITLMLVMIVGGIGLAQVVSDPWQVTLRWLRLGGVIGLSLLAVGATTTLITDPRGVTLGAWVLLGLVGATCVGQLLCVQLARRRQQRVLAGLVFGLAVAMVTHSLANSAHATPDPHNWVAGGDSAVATSRYSTVAAVSNVLLASGLLGGFLMTMLLGHAYLTAGNEMTQAPFGRLVWMLVVLLVLRTFTAGVFGLWPLVWGDPSVGLAYVWETVMVAARFAVGLVVPGVFVWMIYDCVRRRANQSATGILYVATVLVILGEGMGLALTKSTGYGF